MSSSSYPKAFYDVLLRVYDCHSSSTSIRTGGSTTSMMHYDNVERMLIEIFGADEERARRIVSFEIDRSAGARGSFVSCREVQEYIEEVVEVDDWLVATVVTFGRLLSGGIHVPWNVVERYISEENVTLNRTQIPVVEHYHSLKQPLDLREFITLMKDKKQRLQA